MHIIIGSFGGVCVSVVWFQLYSLKAGLCEGNLFWVGPYDPQP